MARTHMGRNRKRGRKPGFNKPKGHFPPIKKADPSNAKQLYLEGWGMTDISRQLLLSRQTIWRYINFPQKLTIEEEMEHLKNSKTLERSL